MGRGVDQMGGQLKLIICAALLAAPQVAQAQDNCANGPPPVALSNVRENYLILKGYKTYALNEQCFTIDRKEFGRVLRFFIFNKFPKEIGVKSGYALVKSNRTFSNAQSVKIKLSRGDGWFLARQGTTQLPAADRIDDEPFEKSVEAWNGAHASVGNPAELSERLGIAWHAFAKADGTLPSSRDGSYWTFDGAVDPTYGAVTNYLLRFDVNTEDTQSLVPFFVYIQPQVRRIELTIASNIDSLATTHTLIIK